MENYSSVCFKICKTKFNWGNNSETILIMNELYNTIITILLLYTSFYKVPVGEVDIISNNTVTVTAFKKGI